MLCEQGPFFLDDGWGAAVLARLLSPSAHGGLESGEVALQRLKNAVGALNDKEDLVARRAKPRLQYAASSLREQGPATSTVSRWWPVLNVCLDGAKRGRKELRNEDKRRARSVPAEKSPCC